MRSSLLRCFALSLACALSPACALTPNAPDAQGLDASDAQGMDASLEASQPEATAPEVSVTPDARRDAGPPADLEGFVQYWLERGGLRGVAALARSPTARVVVLRGMATETMPVQEHTLFTMASISKTFVCALALQLVERGLLDLDADVSAQLGFTVRHPGYPDTPITARMLMTHTSGMVDNFLDLEPFVFDGDPTVSLDAFARAVVMPASHWGARPGASRSYCNAGIGVLARLVERVAQSDIRALTRQQLEGPLALDGAGWFYADIDRNRLALPYVWSPPDAYVEAPLLNYAYYPVTSMMSSLAGLERWLGGHLAGGVVDGTRFLSEASVNETRRVQFPSVSSTQGLVWYYGTVNGRRFLGHSGSALGASTLMRYRPEEGRMLIVLTNSDAYVRSRIGMTAGEDAINQLMARLDTELNGR